MRQLNFLTHSWSSNIPFVVSIQPCIMRTVFYYLVPEECDRLVKSWYNVLLRQLRRSYMGRLACWNQYNIDVCNGHAIKKRACDFFMSRMWTWCRLSQCQAWRLAPSTQSGFAELACAASSIMGNHCVQWCKNVHRSYQKTICRIRSWRAIGIYTHGFDCEHSTTRSFVCSNVLVCKMFPPVH